MCKGFFFQPYPLTKTKKQALTIFFNFCGSVACLLLHFIIWRGKNLHLLLLHYPLCLSLLFRTTLCFLYLNIRTRVKCRTVLSFDLVTSSPSMTLTYLLFFIDPLAFGPRLTSPLLFFLWPYLAPERCQVLITYQFY